MKKLLSLLLVVCVCCLSACEFKPFSENTKAIEKAVKSVVKVFCFGTDGNEICTGSGFVAFEDNIIVTNYHVIEDAYTCKVSTEDDISYTVSNVLAYSEEKDIAILELSKSTELTVFELGDSSTLSRGANVTAIGSPLGLKNTVSKGILSGKIIESGYDILQFTAPISEGSSGGALFDDNGNVIGITFASYVEGQNLNLAIPIELVTELYENDYNSTPLKSFYEDTHPYVKYLSKYSDAIEVTLEELRNNPTKYNQKIVKLKAFVSSHNGSRIYCTTSVDRISDNYEYDKSEHSLSNGNRVPLKSRTTIHVNPAWNYNTDDNYVDSSISVGDEVVIIGNYSYSSLLSYDVIHIRVVYK